MLITNEFEVSGETYRVRERMKGKVAARMMRRCLPLMLPMIELNGKPPALEDIKVVIAGIGNLTDDVEDFIFDNCFAIVDRKQGEMWAPIRPKNAPDVMFSDIDPIDRYMILSSVLTIELGPVFQKLFASLPGAAKSGPA